MKKTGFILLILLAVVFSIYRQFFYPYYARKAKIEAAFAGISEAVSTHESAKILPALQKFIATDAAITLEIHRFSLANPDRVVKQDFDKQSFINFIDTVIYTLTAYEFESELTEYEWSGRNTADIRFTTRQWADGLSNYQGVGVNMRFTSEADCRGLVTIVAGEAVLSKADCKLQLRSVPKPEEAAKFRDPAMLRDFLR